MPVEFLKRCDLVSYIQTVRRSSFSDLQVFLPVGHLHVALVRPLYGCSSEDPKLSAVGAGRCRYLRDHVSQLSEISVTKVQCAHSDYLCGHCEINVHVYCICV